jgi:hypothetical protein
LDINRGTGGCRCDGGIIHRYEGDGLIVQTFDSVHISLSQHLITNRIGKIVQAVCSTVGDKEMMGFNTTFIIVEELML